MSATENRIPESMENHVSQIDENLPADPTASDVVPAPAKPWMSNQIYDALKFLAQIVIPGAGTLYFSLSALWGWPDAEKVVGTLTAIDTFLGLVLGLSSMRYNANFVGKGAVHFSDDVDQPPMSLKLDMAPEDLARKEKVVFKVVKPHE